MQSQRIPGAGGSGWLDGACLLGLRRMLEAHEASAARPRRRDRGNRCDLTAAFLTPAVYPRRVRPEVGACQDLCPKLLRSPKAFPRFRRQSPQHPDFSCPRH
jgi:hypothetical protein